MNRNPGNNNKEAQTLKKFESFIKELEKEFVKRQDPTLLAFLNYLDWKDLPNSVYSFSGASLKEATIKVARKHLSPNFHILKYESGEYASFCTLGASYKSVPYSQEDYPKTGGVRFEYILHSPAEYDSRIAELLAKIAAYPFVVGVPNLVFHAGHILSLDEPVIADSGMEYIYFAYPYLDDMNIYTSKPYGQIQRDNYLIQTFWLLPIYRSEANYVRSHGIDAFENILATEHHKLGYNGFDFFRKPYLLGE